MSDHKIDYSKSQLSNASRHSGACQCAKPFLDTAPCPFHWSRLTSKIPADRLGKRLEFLRGFDGCYLYWPERLLVAQCNKGWSLQRELLGLRQIRPFDNWHSFGRTVELISAAIKIKVQRNAASTAGAVVIKRWISGLI